MALDLANGMSFRKNDLLILSVGSHTLQGTVLNSGEGYLSPYEDMYYLMTAPHQGIEDLFAEENEVKSAFVLAAVPSKEIPFAVLPESASVRRVDDPKTSVEMTVLAVLCGRTGRGEYLLFLEPKLPSKR
jgi:hypothetical protein